MAIQRLLSGAKGARCSCFCRLKTGVRKLIAKSYRCELTAVAFATLLALAGTSAQALSLGRITVQSALGEPLRAEIDIPEISADEASTLKTRIALPAAFQSAGMEYSPVLPGVRMTLQKRPDGRSYLRLSGDRPVQEPFVDMILEANWSTGRIVRDYTLLFDPPVQRAPAQPITAPLMVPKASPTAPSATRSEAPSAPPVAARPPAARPVSSSSAQQVVVRPGQTASKIALAHKSADVSLDQMLVAMQQTNPKAFIEGNVNRIKAGAILSMPTAQQAKEVTPLKASQIITAQSHDFNRFRQELATNATLVKQAPADRNISGTIQANVEDKKSAAQTPDKLTLSKGAVQNAADLEQLALAREAQGSASRAAEISKNTSDLNELSKTAAALAASGAASAAASESAAAAPTTPPSAEPASAPAAKAPTTLAVAAPPPVPERSASFLDQLLANPLLSTAATALVLLLAGLGFYKVRQRQQKVLQDSSFMESGMPSESFFGGDGGQKVDTSEVEVPSSLMAYSPSLLDAENAADPVAEAEVYLAYGRDGQAEGILKDALRAQPERLALHQKLLDIYAKRQDAKAYAAMATLARPLTDPAGAPWAQICKTGLSLDPGNPLYLSETQLAAAQAVPQPAAPPAAPVATRPEKGPGDAPLAADESAVDLDLDLDFSGEQPAPVAPAAETPTGMMAFDLDSLSLDLGDDKETSAGLPVNSGADPLESKLALAEEFKASGDDDGARDLIKQVIAEADGAIKVKAQQALSRL